MHEQENIRNKGQPNYSRLKTAVRRHIDQVLSTRNFRARNEILEGGTVTKSHKGKKANAERRVGDCYQWKANGQCSKGDSCSFRHEPATGNRCAVGREEQSSSPAPKRRRRLTRRYPLKVQAVEVKAHNWTRGRIPCKDFLEGKSTNPSCNMWHLPVCYKYKSKSGCTYGEKFKFRHDEVDDQPGKKSKKSGGKVQLPYWESLYISVEYLTILIRENYSTERRKIGIKSHRQILQSNVAPHQNSEKRRSYASYNAKK